MTWHVPTGCALRVTPRRTLLARAHGDTRLRTIALLPRNRVLLSVPAVVRTTPLLDAILDRVAADRAIHRRTPLHEHLVAVLNEEAYALASVPLDLRLPISDVGLAAADVVTSDPSDTATLEDIASALGVSARTIERAFKSDTELSFRDWRLRVRLTRALERLAGGADVQSTALESGYASASAFVAAVRRLTGLTPLRLARQKKTPTAAKLT